MRGNSSDLTLTNVGDKRLDGFLLIATLLVGGMLAWLSVARYRGYNANMYDLGNMAQAIWSGTRGRPLAFTYRSGPFSRLALHVELVYFLFVPLYALLPSPATLLVAQALLFAAGAFPAYALARRRLGSVWAARGVALIYLLYPVAQTAVLFDLHGDTLAMPLLLFAIEALDRKAWRAYWLWVVLALSCKFYVAYPVAVMGSLLWLRGRRKAGLGTVLVAAGWGMVAFFVVRPLFTPPSASVVESDLPGYASFYFGAFFETLGSSWLPRLFVAVIVFLPVLWAAYRALLWLGASFLVAFPVLVSSGPGPSYHYAYHHYALVVPFLLWALVRGLEAGKGLARSGALAPWAAPLFSWQGRLVVALLTTLLLNVAFVDTPLSPAFWRSEPGMGLHEWRYGRTARDELKDRWLARVVPGGAPLAASSMLAPHLAGRETLYLLRYPDEQDVVPLEERLDAVDYVIADGLFDYAVPTAEGVRGGALYDLEAVRRALERPDFSLTDARDGLLLFQKDAPAEAALSQGVEVSPISALPPLRATFGERVGLAEAGAERVGETRVRLSFEWVALSDEMGETPLFAVSEVEGVEGRILHLPTLALHPTTEWERGTVVREEFEVELPGGWEAGPHILVIKWYDSGSPFAFATDERGRVGEGVALEVLGSVE